MAFIIISMTFLFLIGSLMWLMPTEYQKQKAALRSRARVVGFSPKFIKFDDYLATLPLAFYKRIAPPKEQLVRYTYEVEYEEEQELKPELGSELDAESDPMLEKEADILLRKSRWLQVVFSESGSKPWVLVDSQEITDWTANEKPKNQLNQAVEAALTANKYLDGLIGLEYRYSESKKQISLYWLEKGAFSEIDFQSQQIRGLQASL